MFKSVRRSGISFLDITRAKKIEGVSPKSLFGLNERNLYLGNTERGYEILVYDLDGNLIRKIRKKYKPVPLSDEYRELVKKRYEQAPEFLTKLEFPKSFPPFQMGFADDEGRLFVMTHERGAKPAEYLYDIFNPEGAFVARIGLPSWRRAGVISSPLFAMARKGRIYCFREKENGFQEVVVYKMIWR